MVLQVNKQDQSNNMRWVYTSNQWQIEKKEKKKEKRRKKRSNVNNFKKYLCKTCKMGF